MPVTYTNRKGKTHYLCQGTTRSGKAWYYFVAEPKDRTVDEIPEGYEIHENVNGLISLAHIRPRRSCPKNWLPSRGPWLAIASHTTSAWT